MSKPMIVEIQTPMGAILFEPEYAGRIFIKDTNCSIPKEVPIASKTYENLKYGYCFSLTAHLSVDDLDLSHDIKQALNDAKNCRNGCIGEMALSILCSAIWLYSGKWTEIVDLLKEAHRFKKNYYDIVMLSSWCSETADKHTNKFKFLLECFSNYVFEDLESIYKADTVYSCEKIAGKNKADMIKEFPNRNVIDVPNCDLFRILQYSPKYQSLCNASKCPKNNRDLTVAIAILERIKDSGDSPLFVANGQWAMQVAIDVLKDNL